MGIPKAAGVALWTAMLSCAFAANAQAQAALGANYNEHFEDVDYRDLERAQAKWVRLFLPMPQVDAGAQRHGAVRTILDAGAHGYRTILTLKFPYSRSSFPRPGTPAMDKEFARLDAVLPLVMGKVDILEIGNEPFIESRREDWNESLNVFYEALARRVIEYRRTHCEAECRTRLYMGALNQLENSEWRTATTDRWLAFVKATPEIDGVDIHPHISDIADSKAFLAYVLPRMRPQQTFIATEFSLVWWWKKQMARPVSADYAARYHLSGATRNWQVIGAALKSPLPKEQWDDFLRLSPWFETRKHYLRNQMTIFRDTGRLAVATYGFKQGRSMSAEWGPDKVPWLLNSVYAARSVRPNPDGSAAPNYAWLGDFIAEQRN